MRKIILLSLFCPWMISGFSQAGIIDPTFGGTGIVKTEMGAPLNYKNSGKIVLARSDGSIFIIFETGGLTLITKKLTNGTTDITYGISGYSASIALQPKQAVFQSDGKIIVVGSVASSPNTSNYATARFNTDGSLDNSFGAGGIQVTYFSDASEATAVIAQNNGKIVVAGTFFVIPHQYIGMVRFNADGSLDDSFGDFGTKITDFGLNDFVNSMALQPDGKIVLGGSALIRYSNNGSLDSSFGEFGRTGLAIAASAIAIQPDSRIVIAGNSPYGSDPLQDFTLSRYNPTGLPDNSFGINGNRKIGFGSASQMATALAIQTDGKIVIAGYSGIGNNINFALARYDASGNPDTGFSGDGLQTSDYDGSANYINSIALQTDGKLIALGYTTKGDSSYLTAARYTITGSLDNSFDGDGVITDRFKQGATFFTSTAVQADGKVLAGGYTWNGSNYDFALVRYNLNGTLDNTFSADGKQTTDFGNTDDKIRAIAIQTNGKIIVAGSTGDDFGLARYNTDGSPDVTFDTDGKLTTDFESTDSATSLLIQSDGKIIAAGTNIIRYNSNGAKDATFQGATNLTNISGGVYPFNSTSLALQSDGKIISTGGGTDIIVTRYKANGTVDSTFGENGVYSEYENTATSAAIQPDGKILIGGYRESSDKGGVMSIFLLLRLKSDGSIDESFNGGDMVTKAINYLDYAIKVTVESDKKIILAGYSYGIAGDDFTMARFDTTGKQDNSFGVNGVVSTEVSPAGDRITSAALAGNSLYAIGFGQFAGTFGVAARYLLGINGDPLITPFISANNGNWNSPLTWVGGIVPQATSAVIIHHTVTVTSKTTCYSVKVEPPAGNLIIATGVNLTIMH